MLVLCKTVNEAQIITLENSLPFLEQRYGVSRNAIYEWRKFLGYRTDERHQHYYSPQEIQELDYYFAGCYVPKHGKVHWGLRMGRTKYGELILDAGLRFPDFLEINYQISYEHFLELRQNKWRKKLFGN
ncbi:hypothetical protein H6G97_20955 [Nostoc flagelliforme FACHB-838]|uniref:Transposase n=1 Tax=Nostoc flagelliforme FACHB-838 TaxID=2692904 RepID=A0ABR8DSN5_9NOSO|nr:hypothetical protein [Nostoc flagelliforme]MBD2531920.1 hypothetical protein [Nostoc flagelliforme FACHB-838]